MGSSRVPPGPRLPSPRVPSHRPCPCPRGPGVVRAELDRGCRPLAESGPLPHPGWPGGVQRERAQTLSGRPPSSGGRDPGPPSQRSPCEASDHVGLARPPLGMPSVSVLRACVLGRWASPRPGAGWGAERKGGTDRQPPSPPSTPTPHTQPRGRHGSPAFRAAERPRLPSGCPSPRAAPSAGWAGPETLGENLEGPEGAGQTASPS